jgi:hypothetical protein
MTISLNKISNFFKVRKLKRKIKQLRNEIESLSLLPSSLPYVQCVEINRRINYIELDIALLEQQIKELE